VQSGRAVSPERRRRHTSYRVFSNHTQQVFSGAAKCAVRIVFDHAHEHPSQWTTIRSVAEKLGCRVGALRRWVRQAERDAGKRPGLTTNEREELKRLRREKFELKRANEILRKAGASVAWQRIRGSLDST
jgi:transposase